MINEEACYGIVSRLLGDKYKNWFEFVLTEAYPDFYEISAHNGRIRIRGNSGVCMASGLKYYLEQFCHVYIGQQTVNVCMPDSPAIPEETVIRKASSRIRYAYNYCTLSYTMPFWDEERWQRELDWLALSGVNLVLDFTGIEEVWYRFLSELGYKDEEIRKWIVGPCYTAWQQMGNIEQCGGPVPRTFFSDRAELARKNQEFMRVMGMTPVRQGYNGMVPSWHQEHHPEVTVFDQGMWNGLRRPSIIDFSSDVYRDYASRFLKIQEEVLGEGSHYYAADVFHEGGIRPESLSDGQIAEVFLSELEEYDPQAIWVIQAWEGNPTDGLLSGIKKSGSEHALILDLSATDNPKWEKSEFSHTPWIYCMLDMYGGRVSTHGDVDVLAKIPDIRKRSSLMQGIGFSSEATLHDPIIFDLLFDMAWEEEPADVSEWLYDWLTARYGGCSDNVYRVWEELLDTAYKSPGYSHHGGYTQIFTFRPHLDMSYGETYNELNSTVIKKPYYDISKFENAVLMLFNEAGSLIGKETYCYDMQDLLRQALNNRACSEALTARDAMLDNDEETFRKCRDRFFELFDACVRVMSVRTDTTLSDWLSYAERAGARYGDETEELFVRQAKTLITTWAGKDTYPYIVDYAYRQYPGIMKSYYRPRWERFFDSRGCVSNDEYYEIAENFINTETEKEEILPPYDAFSEAVKILTKEKDTDD